MLSREDIQAVLDQMAHAYSRGDAHAVALLFAEDAQLHSPFAPPAIGRAAIEVLHQDWTAEPSDKTFTVIDWGSTQDMAWCLCRFSEGDEAGCGTSLVVLQPSADGIWRIRSCCLFGDE